jgi:glucosyl-dolichyl phosphate glucuronosyltransferase
MRLRFLLGWLGTRALNSRQSTAVDLASEASFPPSAREGSLSPSVSVVIPALDEANNLPHVFATLPRWVHEVVLVDGGSTDGTVSTARRLRSDLKVVMQSGTGKGDALAAGFAACTGDVIVMLDADGSMDGKEIPRFLDALLGGADFAKGSRFINGGRSDDITPIRRAGNKALNLLVNGLFGTRYTDLCYGFNAFWAHCLPRISLDCDGFEVETLMNIRAAKAGLKVEEVPSHEYNRIHGTSKLKVVRDGRRVANTILRERFRGRQTGAVAPQPAMSSGRDPSPQVKMPPAVPQWAPKPAAGTAPSVDVSVVICAYTEERWEDLLAAVQSVRDQHTQPRETIVVVDHNPSLLDRLRATLSDVMVIPNTQQQGLSGGKNSGIAAAHGAIVAFLDDDATADPGWLTHLTKWYEDPAIAGVGGATHPVWATGRPRWFPAEFDWVVGCAYQGMPETGVPVRNLLGGNASFRRELFAAVGGFVPGIGRAAGKYPLGCEETEFCIRLRQRYPNMVLLFDHRAVIWHRVPESRSTWSYFRSRCYAEGLSKALVTHLVGAADGLSSERYYCTRTLPKGIARQLISAARFEPSSLARAGAIIGGAASAVQGYATGLVSSSWGRTGSGGESPPGVARGREPIGQRPEAEDLEPVQNWPRSV